MNEQECFELAKLAVQTGKLKGTLDRVKFGADALKNEKPDTHDY